MASPLALLALATLIGTPRTAAPPAAVEAALAKALVPPGAHLELLDYRPQVPLACAIAEAEISRPVAASGRAAVHLLGRRPGGESCEGWAWATVRVSAPTLVTSRSLREGEPLAGAVRAEMREVLEGRSRLVQLGPGATAARTLPAGQVLLESDERTGPRPGEAITVAIRIGALEVEEIGRALTCSRGRACAMLPSGKRVEGDYRNGKLQVEAP